MLKAHDANSDIKDDILHLYFNYLDNPHIDEYVCEFGKNNFK